MILPALGQVPVVLQSRGIGVVHLLRDGLPVWAVALFAGVTQLGDTWFLLLLGAFVYLSYGRRAGGFVLGTLFLGFAVTITLKAGLGLPRPPDELQSVAASGFGFPSGHAIGATVGWGALAIALDRVSTARRRAILAAVVIAVVAVSRVAIGVHYLVDVVAGIAVGLAVLGVARRVAPHSPLALFGLAGGGAALAVAVSGAALESVVLLGACGGAAMAWAAVEPGDWPLDRTGWLAGVGMAVAVVVLLAVLAPLLAVGFGGAVVAAAAVLLGPTVRARWLNQGQVR